MDSIGTMGRDAQNDLMQKLAGVITKHGLENDIKVNLQRETVCALAGTQVEDSLKLTVEGKLPPDLKEKVEAFKAEANQVVEGIKDVQIKVESVIDVGCQYDPISGIVPINGGDPITLEHVPGEVWLIDFWATWCPPCQAPMQHNQDMLTKNAAVWGDKVKIIGISIDKTADAVVKHVEAKGWSLPVHYHRANSECSKTYQVNGVPHVMLLDTNGKIVFKGHPATRSDLEADFNTLLKGEEITGDGTKAEGGDAKEEEGAGGDEKDPVACQAYIDKFKNEIAPALQKDERIVAVAKNMPRAFCVMVYDEKYDVVKNKTTIDWKNYRVFVGPENAVETVKTVCDETLDSGAGFEIVLREHKI